MQPGMPFPMRSEGRMGSRPGPTPGAQGHWELEGAPGGWLEEVPEAPSRRPSTIRERRNPPGAGAGPGHSRREAQTPQWRTRTNTLRPGASGGMHPPPPTVRPGLRLGERDMVIEVPGLERLAPPGSHNGEHEHATPEPRPMKKRGGRIG
jgi:hypothetical protein